jgi:hypothetical protein
MPYPAPVVSTSESEVEKCDKPLPEDVQRSYLEEDLHWFELARSRHNDGFYDKYIAQTREELQRLSNKGGDETGSK